MAIDWDQALCRHVQDKDRFHVDQWRGEGKEWARRITREAKEICNEPWPILDECREYAIERPVLEGVYGGMSTYERREERKRRKGGDGVNLFREQYQDAERELLDMAAHLDELVVQSQRTEDLLAEVKLACMRKANPPDIQASLERDLAQFAPPPPSRRQLEDRLKEAEFLAQARAQRAMILKAGVSVRPLPNRGLVIVYDEPRPMRFTRDRLLSPGCSVLVWGVYQLYSLIKSIVMNTVITSQDGHKILWSWFTYRGEPSRADGWRALAALSYVTITWLAVSAVIYSVLMVVF